jgi:hypothetical protein
MFMRVLPGSRVFTPKWGGGSGRVPYLPPDFSSLVYAYPRLSTAIHGYPRQTFNRTENEMRPPDTLNGEISPPPPEISARRKQKKA